MATKKNTKKATAAAPVAKATKTTVITRKSAEPKKGTGFKIKKRDTKIPNNLINIVTAETIGTFLWTMVALYTAASSTLPLYIGLTVAVVIMAIGNISGAHINPAVTFGLWSARRLKTVMVPFYWAAQMLGGVAAVVVVNALSGGAFSVHFDNFTTFSTSIFTIELIGTAIFLFGLMAVISRVDATATAKAFGVGLSLAVALAVTGALTPYVQRSAFTKSQEERTSVQNEEKAEGERTYPREIYITGATLNPAVAVAATELTDSQLQGGSVGQETEKSYSRFGLETVLATLIGAALGANLYLLVSYRAKAEA